MDPTSVSPSSASPPELKIDELPEATEVAINNAIRKVVSKAQDKWTFEQRRNCMSLESSGDMIKQYAKDVSKKLNPHGELSIKMNTLVKMIENYLDLRSSKLRDGAFFIKDDVESKVQKSKIALKDKIANNLSEQERIGALLTKNNKDISLIAKINILFSEYGQLIQQLKEFD